MAGAALVSDFAHELVLFDGSDGVCGMAIFAIGKLFIGIGNSRTVDTVRELVVNAFVACRAGGRNIFIVNRGPFIIMAEHVVRAVTVRAHGAGKQSFSDQPLSVYAAGIVDFDVACWSQFFSAFFKFRMTVSAQLGDIGTVCLIQFIQV